MPTYVVVLRLRESKEHSRTYRETAPDALAAVSMALKESVSWGYTSDDLEVTELHLLEDA